MSYITKDTHILAMLSSHVFQRHAGHLRARMVKSECAYALYMTCMRCITLYIMCMHCASRVARKARVERAYCPAPRRSPACDDCYSSFERKGEHIEGIDNFPPKANAMICHICAEFARQRTANTFIVLPSRLRWIVTTRNSPRQRIGLKHPTFISQNVFII